MVKKIAFLLIAILAAGSLFASGFQQQQQQSTGGPITLSVFSWAGPYTREGADNYFWKEMERRTGIRTVVEMVPYASFPEQINLRWASNSLADVLFKVTLSISDFARDGAIVPIDPYFKDHAPNFSKIMAENADVANYIKQADGHSYGFPYLVIGSTTSPRIFYNKKWLDSTRRAVPGTTQELKEMATLFLNSDYNGNGQRDEIPIYCDNPLLLYRAFSGSFGIRSIGSYANEWDYDAQNRPSYIYASEAGRSLLMYLNDLYTNRLIGQEFFTVDIPKFTAEAVQNRIGFAFIQNSMYLDRYQDDFAALPAPFTGPTGIKGYAGYTNYLQGQGGLVSSNNKHPRETVGWVDYLYSDEGSRLFFMGQEGVTWEYDSNRNPQYTNYVRNNPQGLGIEEALGPYVIWSGGGNPSIAEPRHYSNHLLPKITSDFIANMAQYRPPVTWSPFPFTQRDQERLSILQTDINTYMAEMRARFIRGDEPFSNWNAYVQRLEQMGLRELTEIYQRGHTASINR